MKAKIFNLKNESIGEVSLPKQFEEPVRSDLIKRAVLSIHSNNRQPFGRYEEAGKGYSVRVSKRRHEYKGVYGLGIARTPRKVMSKRGTRMNWVGAFAPNTTGGRRAHPSKASKIFSQKINDKERRKAIRSALSAVVIKEIVSGRGHNLPSHYPIIIDDSFEKIKKTKEVVEVLEKLGFKDEMLRTSERRIRPGKGTMRGRRYTQKKGLLIVVANKCDVEKSAANIPGINVVEVKHLNAEVLAPGTMPGRITLFTKDSIEKINKEKLFM